MESLVRFGTYGFLTALLAAQAGLLVADAAAQEALKKSLRRLGGK